MGIWEIVSGVLMIVVSISIILLVVMQESTKGGVDAMMGSESYYNKNPGRTFDALLSKATKIAAIAFFVVTILAYAAIIYLK